MITDPLFFPVVILTLFVAIFIMEFRRHEKKGGKHWFGKLFLSLIFITGIPALLMLSYVLYSGDQIIPEPVDARTEATIAMTDIYISIAVCLILPCILYFIAKKLIK